VPASNMKILTTAAALYALGPDFRYTTFLLILNHMEQEREIFGFLSWGGPKSYHFYGLV
ncbi:MAG: D-alanyl-D-alanine carboxypeptidase, partial [Thermoplasmata archaeon]